ncbi:dihydrodipicolinate synthase family protein, partial [Sphaerochaeta sp.]|uniref:dihydrodipicolinate synthase family protein n=1 Tax=Sphaerochaeta sp. TaxID=1972642 RepID=UPI003D096B51
MKYTASTHHEILRIKEEIGKDFKVYSGSDEMALSGLAYGSDGLIGSFYNVIPE